MIAVITLFQIEPAPKECIQNTENTYEGTDSSLLLNVLILILYK